MPSCAVKTCKNTFTTKEKLKGITFHRFPVDKDMRDKWTAAVQKSRNNPQWLPSCQTMVCSVHFDEDDIYVTIKGLFRVKRGAYPKKMLYLTSSVNPVMPMPNSPSTSVSIPDASELSNVDMALSSAAPVLEDTPNCLNTNHMNLQPYVGSETVPSCFMTACPNCAHHFWASVSVTYQTMRCKEDTNKLSNEIGFNTPFPTLTSASCKDLSSLPNKVAVDKVLPSTSLAPVLPATTQTMEQDIPIFDTLRKDKLRRKLQLKEKNIENKKKKIKILQQTVRRLQKRNKSLKEIISTLQQ